MTWTGCEEFGLWFSAHSASEPVRSLIEAKLAAGAGPREIALLLAGQVEGLHPRVTEELESLPQAGLQAIVDAWLLALRADKPFELRSVRPDRPLEMARSRSFQVTLDLAEEAVGVTVSHIPSRHPTWDAPERV